MNDGECYRQELRATVKGFSFSWDATGAQQGPRAINLYMFGPQGSGKTSFIRTCYRALYGPRHLDKNLSEMETRLHRSDDGTSQYSIYSLTDHICLHDTRGQREYTPEEMEQLKLVLEGRARPNTLIQQRRRYWLLLREFWRTDEQMQRTFSQTVMLQKATIDTEPHFAFLVLDPNQQELLLEDADFRQCYGSLVGDFAARGVPYALLCTHGDTLTPQLRETLLQLPTQLGVQQGRAGVGDSFGGGGPPPGGVAQRPGPPLAGNASWGGSPPPPSASPQGGQRGSQGNGASPPQRMPEIMRIVTNYVDTVDRSRSQAQAKPVHVERDQDGNDVQQDIHVLLVLLDSLQQAENQIKCRLGGSRPVPIAITAEVGCPLL